jgi:ketosteroid isomerase-like protein
LTVLALTTCKNNKTTNNNMSEQKQIVEKYMDGFRATDHELILSCLTDDVVWELPGFYLYNGKAALDKEIKNPNADGHPDIKVTRLVEDGNIVVAEGTVKAKMKDGSKLDGVFCDAATQSRTGHSCDC